MIVKIRIKTQKSLQVQTTYPRHIQAQEDIYTRSTTTRAHGMVSPEPEAPRTKPNERNYEIILQLERHEINDQQIRTKLSNLSAIQGNHKQEIRQIATKG